MAKKLYKFLKGMKSENGSHEWEKGEWYNVEGELEICKNGFHASEHIQDALNCVQGDTLAVVEVDGEHIEDDDKQCWERMKVVETYDWTKVESLKLAIYSAKQSKEYFDGDEEIIDDCIDVAEKILNEYEHDREPSDEIINKAESAELTADSVRAATWSTEESARSAALAAWSAAWSARSTARSAAESLAKQDIHEHCLKIVKED